MPKQMNNKDFRRWRKSLKLSQKDAAEALGLKRRVVQYYEKGERDGAAVSIPKYVRLACYALAQGVKDYSGPAKTARKGRPTDAATTDAHEAPTFAFGTPPRATAE